MKKIITIIAPIVAYIGLPASFIAAAFHQAAPQTSAANHGLLEILANQPAGLFAPVVFAITVMSFAMVVVHNLREDERIAEFTKLNLRFPATEVKKIELPRKRRLATARAI